MNRSCHSDEQENLFEGREVYHDGFSYYTAGDRVSVVLQTTSSILQQQAECFGINEDFLKWISGHVGQLI